MRVERFSIGFGNPIASFKRGDTIFQIAPIPLGGFVQITGLNPHEEFDRNDPFVYPNRPRWMRMAVLVAGPGANYLTAVLLTLIIALGAGVADTLKISEVKPQTPAAEAGIKAGDLLIEANGQPVSTSKPITTVILASQGKPVTIKVQRNGQVETVVVTPRQIDGAYRMGAMITSGDRRRVGVGEAAVHAVVMPIVFSGQVLANLWEVVTGKQKASFAGPIGIAGEISKAASSGILDYVTIIALLSVYLGLFNLLPLPALDGGRVLFVLLSVLGLKQITAKTETAVHAVGLVLLLGLLLVVSFNDVVKLISKFTG